MSSRKRDSIFNSDKSPKKYLTGSLATETPSEGSWLC